MKAAALVVVLLFIAGCAIDGSAPPSPPPPLPPLAPTSSAAVASVSEPTVCTAAPPRPWALLCQAYELAMLHHVDLPDPTDLAAAAAGGVRALPSQPSQARDEGETIRCVIPHPSFGAVCDEILDRQRFDGIALDDLVGAAVHGMFRFGLDPFSSYLAPDFADRLDLLGSGHVLSLGLIVGARDDGGHVCGPLSSDCLLRILAVSDFGAAAAAGVLVGDVIAAIGDLQLEGLSEAEAVARLQGPAGTTMHLTMVRGATSFDRSLVHEVLRVAAAEFAMLGPSLAYLRLNDFSQAAAQHTGEVLTFTEVEAASAMILDLRDNPGGLVLSAQAIASQFLDGGLVLVEETRHEDIEVAVLPGGLARPDMRLFILTNRGTASAGEVVAAVLQERGRATVVGEPTFGKNLVQQVYPTRNGGEIRVSVARWKTPGGLDIGVRGLSPDVDVSDVRTEGVDAILEHAVLLAGTVTSAGDP